MPGSIIGWRNSERWVRRNVDKDNQTMQTGDFEKIYDLWIHTEGMGLNLTRRLYMENLIVRYAKREELESVNNIRKQVNEVHVKGRPDIFREDGWQFIEPFVYTRFDEENSGVIVADVEDEIVGFAVVQYIVRPESPYNKERRYSHIEEFGVDEKHRRKGIAAAMIDFIKEDAKNRGFKRIELDMWEFNDGALAFYENAGLKTYRRYMESDTDTEEGNRT